MTDDHFHLMTLFLAVFAVIAITMTFIFNSPAKSEARIEALIEDYCHTIYPTVEADCVERLREAE